MALSITEDPHNSIRKLQQQHNLSFGTVQSILTKKLKFYPYKVHLVQEPNNDDPDRRLEFTELMMNRMDADVNFFNGSANRNNILYWNDTNPHWNIDSRSSQYPQKLNVWAGIIDRTIKRPFFIKGNLDGPVYENLLRDHIVFIIRLLVGNDIDRTWYPQDGAAPHYAVSVRNYLNQIFAGRCIGQQRLIEWPARTPDVTLLDYFLRGYLKDRVYRTKPANIEKLQQRVRDEIDVIEPEMIQRAVQAFYNRTAYCQENNGQHFEHKL